MTKYNADAVDVIKGILWDANLINEIIHVNYLSQHKNKSQKAWYHASTDNTLTNLSFRCHSLTIACLCDRLRNSLSTHLSIIVEIMDFVDLYASILL